MARDIYEVSAPYGNFMVNPVKVGHPRACPTCHSFAGEGYGECRACGQQPDYLSAIVPVTFSIAREQMHHALRNYKDGATEGIRRRMSYELTAVLWRFLLDHEPCVQATAGVDEFDVVTTVPSGTRVRDSARRNLRRIVGELCGATSERYERVLIPTDRGLEQRWFDGDRYEATRNLDGATVLLIDDTWTTGHSAQSAAYTLQRAGASVVAMVPIGRHVNPEWDDHDELLNELPRPFDWEDCVVHA